MPLHRRRLAPPPHHHLGLGGRYFTLLAPDNQGTLVQIAKSKHINQNLNPTWEPVEVSSEVLGQARELKLQVWDHDIGRSDDLIGEQTLQLPDLQSLLNSLTHRSEIPALTLFYPKGAPPTSGRPLRPHITTSGGPAARAHTLHYRRHGRRGPAPFGSAQGMSTEYPFLVLGARSNREGDGVAASTCGLRKRQCDITTGKQTGRERAEGADEFRGAF